MKVQDFYLNQCATPQVGGAGAADPAAPASTRKPGETKAGQGSDQVQLSGLSGQLLQTLGAGSADLALRLEKLAAHYRSGRYQPDSLATSRGIIAEAMHDEP
jgi:hypothetical protein